MHRVKPDKTPILRRSSGHKFRPFTKKLFVIDACWEMGESVFSRGETLSYQLQLWAGPCLGAAGQHKRDSMFICLFSPLCTFILFWIFLQCWILLILILIFFFWGKGVWTWSWMGRRRGKHDQNILYNFLKNRKWSTKESAHSYRARPQ